MDRKIIALGTRWGLKDSKRIAIEIKSSIKEI